MGCTASQVSDSSQGAPWQRASSARSFGSSGGVPAPPPHQPPAHMAPPEPPPESSHSVSKQTRVSLSLPPNQHPGAGFPSCVGVCSRRSHGQRGRHARAQSHPLKVKAKKDFSVPAEQEADRNYGGIDQGVFRKQLETFRERSNPSSPTPSWATRSFFPVSPVSPVTLDAPPAPAWSTNPALPSPTATSHANDASSQSAIDSYLQRRSTVQQHVSHEGNKLVIVVQPSGKLLRAESGQQE